MELLLLLLQVALMGAFASCCLRAAAGHSRGEGRGGLVNRGEGLQLASQGEAEAEESRQEGGATAAH